MIVYTREKIKKLLRIDFIRFSIVGGTGFVINFVILTLLHSTFHWPVFIAQLIGSEIALFSNFMLHHHWTYIAHKVDKSFPKLLLQFHASSWIAIVGSALMVTASEHYLHLSNLTSLVISSLIALLWNFVWSKYIIWRDIKSNEIEEIVK